MNYRSLLLAGACLISPEVAFAQAVASAAADDTKVDEIIVTAQRRSENVNRVGISIVAVQGDDLARLNITRTEDLTKIVPTLTVAMSSNNTPIYTLRGIGFQTRNLTSSSPVGVYVDEVSYTYPYFASDIAYDIERVEVLKGPQGTLYGRSTTGGLINYITAKPSQDASGSLTLGVGNYESYLIDGHFTGPVTPTLSFRVSGKVELRENPWQRSVTRPDDRLGKANRKALRGQVLWEPGSDFDALLSLSYWDNKSDTQAPQLIQYRPLSEGPWVPTLAAQAQGSLLAGTSNAALADWTPSSYQPNPGITRPPYRGDGRFYGTMLRLNYRPSDAITVTSLTSYNDGKREDVANGDGVTFNALTTQNFARVKSFSQELRIAGSGDRFNWLVGGYYSNDSLHEAQRTYTSDFSTAYELTGLSVLLKADPTLAAAILGVPAPFVPGFVALAGFNTAPYSVEQIATSGLVTQYPLDGTAKSYAGFFNADYKFTDQLKLTLGGRYTRDERSNRSCAANFQNHGIIAGIFMATVVVQQPRIFGSNECQTSLADYSGFSGPVNDQLNEGNFSFRGALDWTPAPNTLVYISFARGYKSGAYPVVPANVTTQLEPATQERLQAVEAGVKAGLFDRRVQLNMAGYYYDYQDKQVYGRIADPIFTTLPRIVNLPQSEAYGAEAELTWRVTPQLDLRASAAYQHTKIKRYTGFDDYGVLRDYAGARFPYSPEWSMAGSLSYNQPVSQSLNLDATISATYQSRSSSRFIGADANTPAQNLDDRLFDIPSYALVDANIGIGTDGWRASLWVRNLFNKFYLTATDTGTDTAFRYVGMPRTYGAQVKFNF